MTRPTDDLIRAVLVPELPESAILPSLVRADDDEQLGTMTGHFAVFDVWTEINSLFEGHFLERIRPGAFKKTIRESRDSIKVLFNHGMDPSIGDKPLGRPKILREDDVGGYAEVPLDDTSYNKDLAASMRSRALDGQSFRFRVTREEWREQPEKSKTNPKGLPERDVLEVRLFEFGPVTFPAYQATTVGIRSREAYALWLGTPPAQRVELFRKYGLEIPDAALMGTSEDDDATPPTGTWRSSKATALAFLTR